MLLAILLSFASLSCAPQHPPLPTLPELLPAIALGNASNLLRFVDFHQQLDRPGLVAVTGQLEKWKEGKRERLRQGMPAGGMGAIVVAGSTQYFKVKVRTAVQARAVFAGTAKGKVEFDCELQVARGPDGTERWQAMTPGATPMASGMLALFVLAPSAAGKRPELLHAIAFDPRLDSGPSPQDRFVDTMHDFVTINRRVGALEAGIAAMTAGGDAASNQAARQRLAELLAATVELHQPEQRTLLATQTAPFELRARELLAAPAEPGGPVR